MSQTVQFVQGITSSPLTNSEVTTSMLTTSPLTTSELTSSSLTTSEFTSSEWTTSPQVTSSSLTTSPIAEEFSSSPVSSPEASSSPLLSTTQIILASVFSAFGILFVAFTTILVARFRKIRPMNVVIGGGKLSSEISFNNKGTMEKFHLDCGREKKLLSKDKKELQQKIFRKK